jgi:hypothetical protein
MASLRTGSGRELCKKWKVDARGYYHKDGTWYEVPLSFPAALWDPNGYAYFKTEADLANCNGVTIGAKVNMRHGISSLLSYKRVP